MESAHSLRPGSDPFHDGMMGLVALLLLFLTLGSAIGFAMVYYGDQVAVPSWNERVMPLPRTYWQHPPLAERAQDVR